MIIAGPAALRYLTGLIFSVVLNLALIVSLAELDRPADAEDTHDAHRVAPSVVEPPPPEPPAKVSPAEPHAATALPTSPPAPNLDLPAPTELTDDPALAFDSLGNVGLGDLDVLTAGTGFTDPEPTAPDEPPQLAVPPDLTRFYPQPARQRKLSGRTILALTVDDRGRVVGVKVLLSEPPGLFERAAQRAARTFRFTPATRAGRPISARTRLELKWQLPN